MEKNKGKERKGSNAILTQAQLNEFELIRIGYYCKVREEWEWNKELKKSIRKGFKFDIVQYEDDQEVVIKKGTVLFNIGENEGVIKRNQIIESYLKNLKNN